jgi:hypothetical protein
MFQVQISAHLIYKCALRKNRKKYEKIFELKELWKGEKIRKKVLRIGAVTG